MAYPIDLDTYTDPNPGDKTNSPSLSGLLTTIHSSLEAMQTKLGIDSSAVATSIDYLLKNVSSSNPGHKHTLADGATDVTSTAAELNQLDGVSVGGNTAGDVLTTDGTQTTSNKTLTSPVLNTGVSGTAVKDEDDMSSDSATAVATQQSIKAYVDKKYAFRAYSGSAQSINDSTNTVVTIDTVDFDPDGAFDDITDNRFEAPVTGIYRFNWMVSYTNLADGVRNLANLHVNGTLHSSGDDDVKGGASRSQIGGSDLVSLTIGDYVEVNTFHDAGVSEDLDVTKSRTYLSGELIQRL